MVRPKIQLQVNIYLVCFLTKSLSLHFPLYAGHSISISAQLIDVGRADRNTTHRNTTAGCINSISAICFVDDHGRAALFFGG